MTQRGPSGKTSRIGRSRADETSTERNYLPFPFLGDRLEPKLARFDRPWRFFRFPEWENVGPKSGAGFLNDGARSFGIEAEIEKACRLLAQCPVLRKIPTGLPHQPERAPPIPTRRFLPADASR
jgi:hypothetical protein